MASTAPKYKIEYIEGSEVEVQTRPIDVILAGRQYPAIVVDEDKPGFDVFRLQEWSFWVAWHALVREKLITEAIQRQKFDAWLATVDDVSSIDTEDESDPTLPPDQTESS